MSKASRQAEHIRTRLIAPEIALQYEDKTTIPMASVDYSWKTFRTMLIMPVVATAAIAVGIPVMNIVGGGLPEDIENLAGPGTLASFLSFLATGVTIAHKNQMKYALQADFGEKVNRQALKKIRLLQKNLKGKETKTVKAQEVFGETPFTDEARTKNMELELDIYANDVRLIWTKVPDATQNWDTALDSVSNLYSLETGQHASNGAGKMIFRSNCNLLHL